MSWHYLQEQEVVSSEDISWDGEQFVQSKSKTTLGEYCLPDSETECFQDSPYGMTLRRSTENPGEAELMWYQGDSPVRTYLPQEKEQEFVVSDLECGPRWPESLARYDPVTSSWRTAQCSLVEGLELYSEIFPYWGMMHDGEFWEQGMLVESIEETEFGYLPTPRSCSAMAAKVNTSGNQSDKRFPNLETIIGKIFLPTPQASDNRDRGKFGDLSVKRRITIGKQINLSQMLQGEPGQYLNPAYVEEIMVWPIAWTDLKPLAMDKFQQWQHLHGNY